jgi:hypothetical protein
MTLQTGSSPAAVAIGDVNGDGRSDVVLVTSFGLVPSADDNKLLVFLQNAAGGLDPPIKYTPAAGTIYSVAIGDVNHDGRNDVVVGGNGKIQVFLQDPAGALSLSATYPSADSNWIRIADLNNDGLLDVVGIGAATGTVAVWLQKGDGELNAPVSYAVTHGGGIEDIEVGDLNNDGLIDLAVINSTGSPNVGVLIQEGGVFKPPAYYTIAMPGAAPPKTFAVAVGDVSGDGRNDLILTGSYVDVYLQGTAVSLGATKVFGGSSARPVRAADINNDGLKDIVCLYGDKGMLGIYRQKGDGTLQGEEVFALPRITSYKPPALAVGDINGDGLTDVVIFDPDNGLVLLYGNSAWTAQKVVTKKVANSGTDITPALLRRMKTRRY